MARFPHRLHRLPALRARRKDKPPSVDARARRADHERSGNPAGHFLALPLRVPSTCSGKACPWAILFCPRRTPRARSEIDTRGDTPSLFLASGFASSRFAVLSGLPARRPRRALRVLCVSVMSTGFSDSVAFLLHRAILLIPRPCLKTVTSRQSLVPPQAAGSREKGRYFVGGLV
jgi:hypothetical protein